MDLDTKGTHYEIHFTHTDQEEGESLEDPISDGDSATIALLIWGKPNCGVPTSVLEHQLQVHVYQHFCD